MKNIMLAISAFILMSGFAFGGAVNEKCPISGKAVGDATSTVEAPVCCGKCQKKVNANPGKYLAKVATTEEGKCVISGKDASKTAEITVGFCCEKCKGKFDADVKGNLEKVEVPKPKKEDA
jgi:endogenous inhibitor of DNA gyrase (YacG/DUF329 family)